MGRKVFISVLGTGNYGACKYVKDDYQSESVRFIQEATIEFLCRQQTWGGSDVAYVLLTDGAERNNWLNDGHRDKDTKEVIKCEGLCSRMQSMNLPFTIETIKHLPDGNNEGEIWEIFERVYAHLQDGDELYFDLTHGFRYLPMLVMVLINYSKFLKNTIVKSITYGNYESRNRQTNEAPIIDLLPLSSLQDWSFAAGQFLESGSVRRITDLCNQEIKPILKASAGKDENAAALRNFARHLHDVIEERQNCRGLSIIKSENFAKLKTTTESLESTIIAPLNPLFNKIKASLRHFDEKENIQNALSAAIWCFENNLLQQSATILQEFVITFFCSRHGIRIDDELARTLVSSAITISYKNIPQNEWTQKTPEEIAKIKEILADEYLGSSKLIELYNNLSEVRNDINHSGMRSLRLPQSSQCIKKNIEKCIHGIYEILKSDD